MLCSCGGCSDCTSLQGMNGRYCEICGEWMDETDEVSEDGYCHLECKEEPEYYEDNKSNT